MKIGCRLLVFVVSILLLAGCSMTYNVKTEETKELTKQLKEDVEDIKKVHYSFMRPDLTITVEVKEELSEEKVATILKHVQGYTTVHTMNKIGASVNWDTEISEVHLRMVSLKTEEMVEYVTTYFKSSNASDYSPSNIDAYTTWIQVQE